MPCGLANNANPGVSPTVAVCAPFVTCYDLLAGYLGGGFAGVRALRVALPITRSISALLLSALVVELIVLVVSLVDTPREQLVVPCLGLAVGSREVPLLVRGFLVRPASQWLPSFVVLLGPVNFQRLPSAREVPPPWPQLHSLVLLWWVTSCSHFFVVGSSRFARRLLIRPRYRWTISSCSSPSAARCSSAHQLSHVNQIEFLSSVGRWWLSFTLFLFFGTWWIVDHLCLLLLVLVVVVD
ncbi:hypothetical protein PI124_g20891 [Phytophthora idaei]|nr:hypothetical protein PI125_g22379 [Phytophthora idaei]KAG3130308.1 hypothetical protein PI126_g20571 [Phytophthora idaei]KAG3234055.1 hypothetical protein PI124_g20891 [Phytophthora idaei]